MNPPDQYLENLSDPLWRLDHLYKIITKRDGIQPFRPFPYQRKLYEDIFIHKRRKHVVIKARRMGFSTAIAILALDLALFNSSLQASIVDLTQDDAREKVRSKIHVAWEQACLEGWPQELGMFAGYRGDGHRSWSTGSHIYAGINARGGTNHLLHVSEWGPIAHQDPARSKKILTGALPSADEGVVLIETTWMGGKTGELWNIVKDAMDTPDEEKTEQDFWFHFSPWYSDPRHTLKGDRDLDEETEEYLNKLEADLDVKFSPGQRQWYFVNKQRYKDDMNQEYPSTPEEAFDRRVEGSIYGKWISKIRARGQISDFPLEKRQPVHIFADLGIADYLPLWFVQFVGQEIRCVDWYENNGEGLTHYAQVIRQWEKDHPEAILNTIYLPHDGDHKQLSTGETLKSTLEQLLPHVHVEVVQRTKNIYHGIDWLRDNFERIWLHKTNTGTPRSKDGMDHPSGIECLENYHQKEAMAGTNTSKVPVHDMYSHSCDALRTMAEAIIAGKVSLNSSPRQRRQQFKAPSNLF